MMNLFSWPLSARRNRESLRQLAAVLPLVWLGFCTSLSVPAPAQEALARAHKLRVSDAALTAQLLGQGARLLADYGSFQLLETTATMPAPLAARAGAEDADDLNFIHLNTGSLDTTAPAVQALRADVGAFTGRRLHLVHFAGPVKPEWRDALEQSGARIVAHIPNDAYLIYGDAAALGKMQAWAGAAVVVQWEGPFLDRYKIHPRARTVDEQGRPHTPATDTFAIQLVEDPAANATTLRVLDTLKLAPVRRQSRALGYLNLIVRLPAERLTELAAQPEVVSIHPYVPRRKFDERQNQIMAGNLTGHLPSGPGYLAWLASKGFSQAQFTASGFVVDVSDSGIDNGTATPGHFALYALGNAAGASRVAYNRLEGTGNSGSTKAGCDGHGNLNAHIIGGYSAFSAGFPHADASGYAYGLGVCPFVRVGSSVVFDPDLFTDPSYDDLQSRAYHDGARISGNSWGGGASGAYDVDAQIYDALVRDAQPSGAAFATSGNQPMIIVFAAGNDGPSATTLGSPGTAKNVIVVGAAENVRSHATASGGNSATGNDGCGSTDADANSAHDIADFSSRGPCSDGRKKPDLVAPGTHITGGMAQNSPPPATSGTGSALSCYNASGVCGLDGSGTAGSPNNFFPLNQQFYSTSSGTSHSTPAVAGACALLYQDFINRSLPPPSPALAKAFLMNSARYMNGTYANDTLPSNNQGLGAVNLGTAFDGVSRVLRDQTSADKFTASGQTRTIAGTISDSGKPFRVTLAWTDAPGSTTGNAYNNNLDLTVIVGGVPYKGNVFSGANSLAGGASDAKNNVESVFLPAGASGNFIVTVTAANINSDGVPNEAPALDQDYALVIYNALENTDPIAPIITTQPQSQTAAAGQSPSFSVSAGGTAPFWYQWRFQGANIPGANSNLFTRASVQTNHAGAYSVVITNIAGAVTSAVATLTVTVGQPVVLAQWNFNSQTPDASTTTGTTTPSTGTGTAVLVGGTAALFATGSASDPASSDNSGWNTDSYPAQGSNNKTAGARFTVSTAGWKNIVVRWDHRASSTGSKYARLQYTTNGTTFLDFPTTVALSAGGSYEAQTNRLIGLPGVDDNASFAFRIVSEWQSTALGTANSNYIPASSSASYGPGGTIRLDLVTVTGEPVTLSDPTATLGAAALATGVFHFNVTGLAGSRYVVLASTNLTTWERIFTNTSPFTFTDPNPSARPQRFYRSLYEP